MHVMREIPARRALQFGRRAAVRLFAFVLVTLLIFMFIEGFCSTALLVADLWPGPVSRKNGDHIYMHYDPELGWVNNPNLYLKNAFGPGIYLRTNAQGFRNATTISQNDPPGKIRVLCSGDSFTFGYGVDNRQTWCALLSDLDGRLQTVNMGQNGYGTDQSYLLYKRASGGLQYQVQIFAFITDDFRRMETDFLFGSGKPVLSVHDGQLVEQNVPVPRYFLRSKLADWKDSYGTILNESRTVQFLDRVAEHFHLTTPPTDISLGDQQKWNSVVAAILDSLKALNESNHSTLVLVYLPSEPDHCSNANLDRWRSVVRDEAARKHILFIDLVDAFQKLPETARLFIQPGAGRYIGEVGHYTIEGNQYIAKELYSHLLQLGVLGKKDAIENQRRSVYRRSSPSPDI
jgi:hypothetical protein